MRMCELRQKEVINCRDCQRLGFVCDVVMDFENCCLLKIIVPGPCRIWGIIGHDHEYIINCCCIKQVGADIILVDIDAEKALVKCSFN